ncbi:MAG: response regulator [Oscillospiraceae bacterium]|nr:response regulator [Oscillospiraceae bacterium]
MSGKKKHILVMSGNPLVLAEIKMGLIAHFDVSIAAAASTALTVLERHQTAAAVIHIGEDRERAFAALAEIRLSDAYKYLPVIFLAEQDSEADETAAFAAGAVDYAIRRHGSVTALIDRLRFRIFAAETEPHSRNGDSASAAHLLTPENVLSGKTILVVDDVELNREIITGIFSGIQDLSLEFAENGQEALNKFAASSERFSLIFMDVQMPVMDGLEATKAIRALPCKYAREVPIIALTASVGEEEVSRCLEAGMNDFIEKPMVFEEFLNTTVEYCR